MIIARELAKIKASQPEPLPCRYLSRDEIEALERTGQITPPDRIRERSHGPRVSFPDFLNSTTYGLKLSSKRIAR